MLGAPNEATSRDGTPPPPPSDPLASGVTELEPGVARHGRAAHALEPHPADPPGPPYGTWWLFPGDVRQARLTLVGLAIMAVLSAALLAWAIRVA